MQIYKVPINDMKFLINDFLNLSLYKSIYKNSDFEISDLEMILDEAAKLCEEILLPINQKGDIEACNYNNGIVTTPNGFKNAYKNFIENGWQGIRVSEKYGGQNLPYFMNMFIDEMISSANMSFGLYPGLTSNAIEAIENSASEELKNLYLPKLTKGEWSGTMNLTEPQCGTDLGLSKAIAIPQNDGTFKLTGTKIFITCGEHDLSKNIIHLVLARTPNAPDGIKGISLFLVPKIIPNKDGSLDKKNNLECASIEKKMGINASPTCVMKYDDAKAWLVGDLNKGMQAMFVMMNGARIFVGIQGLGISEISYQSALYYAKERLQGKGINKNKGNNELADPIIVHPEIRKNLCKIKSLNEALRGLIIWTGLHIDISKNSKQIEERQFSDDIVCLMTPIIKSFASDIGCTSSNDALQMYGGHGYIKEHGIEQFVRDARIAPIYEGTNGIQALDLVTRKLQIDNGRLYKNFFKEISQTDFYEIEKNNDLKVYLDVFKKSFEDLKKTTSLILNKNTNDPNELLGPAVDYLKMFALVSLGYTWVKFLLISIRKINESNNEFYNSKLASGKFFIEQILPETYSIKLKIESGSNSYNDYDDKFFDLGFK
tara:strand:+ start:2827 stop:4629 length:1803 start_codon:yes stop_codon:yes gene_type:complete